MQHPPGLQEVAERGSAATWPIFAIATILFAMRSYARLSLHTDALGWDDVVITISWLFCLVRQVTLQLAMNATERVTADDFPNTVPAAGFWVIFSYTWAFVSIALPKLGVGILINRLFRPAHWLRVFIIGFCISLNILAVVALFLTFFECDPVEGQWDPYKHPNVKCWNQNIQLIYACTLSGISAITDLAFTVYPSVIIWNLKMPKWTRISTIALMGLGVASFAIALVKLWANTQLKSSAGTVSTIIVCVRIAMWSSIENDFVLSAACLPAVPPCIRACRSFFRSHFRPNSRSYHQSFMSFRSSSRSDKRDDSGATELVSHGEPPGMAGIKVGWSITRESHPA